MLICRHLFPIVAFVAKIQRLVAVEGVVQKVLPITIGCMCLILQGDISASSRVAPVPADRVRFHLPVGPLYLIVFTFATLGPQVQRRIGLPDRLVLWFVRQSSGGQPASWDSMTIQTIKKGHQWISWVGRMSVSILGPYFGRHN
jgi:hypothetical protein